jgi:hypothetical protein
MSKPQTRCSSFRKSDRSMDLALERGAGEQEHEDQLGDSSRRILIAGVWAVPHQMGLSSSLDVS